MVALTTYAQNRGRRYNYDFCFYLITLLFTGGFNGMVT